jgi:hypothetical protein
MFAKAWAGISQKEKHRGTYAFKDVMNMGSYYEQKSWLKTYPEWLPEKIYRISENRKVPPGKSVYPLL